MPKQSSSPGIDLAQIFGAAAQALAANQSALNQADSHNGNHGDNMVQTFNLITQALDSQKNAQPSDALAYASQVLNQNTNSGSAAVYAQGLAQAAQQFQGQQAVTPENGMGLLQALMGGGASPSAGGGMDLLGSLLGGGNASSGGALDSLMDLAKGEKLDGQDVSNLLNAGMAFLNAKNQGQDTMQAAVSALVSGGPLGQQPHRQQSGEVVAGALMQAMSALGKK
ncbi:MAG: DAK2 domain-containing protein [Chloroflexota bacterium]